MSIHYFDASTLVKYYLDEPGSTWVREIVDATMPNGQPVHVIYTSALSLVEVPAAVAIVRRTGRISNNLRLRVFLEFTLRAAARYQFIQAEESVLKDAARLTQKYFL